jgi:hypothetical protein
MSKLCKTALAALIVVAVALGVSAQTVTTLLEFNGDNGASPDLMPLAQGIDGDLYGTTSTSYPPYYGTIFTMT